jgi:hypothetical protein
MPDTLTTSETIQFAAVFLAWITALVTLWWRIELRIRDVENYHEKKYESLLREHNDLKLHIAERYANMATVKEGEKRLADRIEGLTEQVIKMPDIVVERMMKYMSIKAH